MQDESGASSRLPLSAVQHQVVGVTAVSDASRERAACAPPVFGLSRRWKRVSLLTWFLVTVPDDVLPELVRGLGNVGAWRQWSAGCTYQWATWTGCLVRRHQTLGAIPLAMHPVMTFTGTTLDVDRLHGSVFGVTAPTPFLPIADALGH